MGTPCRWYRSVPRLPDPPPTRHRRGQSHSKLLVHSLHRTLPAHHRDAGQQSSGRRQGRQARSADPSRVGRQAPRLRVVAPAVLRHRNRRALRRALPPLLLAPACPPQPAGFVGAPCSLTLRARGDDVLGLDNFNAYYDPALKRVHQRLLAARGVYARAPPRRAGGRASRNARVAGVRASNVAGLVALFEATARHADP
jgi:hypothetical protein